VGELRSPTKKLVLLRRGYAAPQQNQCIVLAGHKTMRVLGRQPQSQRALPKSVV
jgi:hypothetical protein